MVESGGSKHGKKVGPMDIPAQLLKYRAHSASLAAIRECRAAELSAEGEGVTPIPGGRNLMPEQAAAGLWTTAEDLAGFGIHIQDLLEMEGTRCRAGLRCFLKTIGDAPYFGHSGGNEGFESLVNFSVRGGNGSCILVNGNNMGSLIRDLQSELLKVRKNDDRGASDGDDQRYHRRQRRRPFCGIDRAQK